MRRAVVSPRAGARRKGAAFSRAGREAGRPRGGEPAGEPGGRRVPTTGWSASSPSSSTSSARRGRRTRARRLSSWRTGPSRGDVFAVFKVGQGLQILQSFTEDRKNLPAAIEKATMGLDQARDPARNPGYDNATEEAFSLARDAQAAAKAHEPDARFMAMQAQMLLFTDSVMREGQGQASLQPLLAIARAPVARPGPQVPPLLLRGSRRPAAGRGALPDDREHRQPVERLGLRVRRAGAARPLALGRDEAGARPGPRDRVLRPDRHSRGKRSRAHDGHRPLGDGAGRDSASTGRASCGTSRRARAASSWPRRTTSAPGSSA